MANPIFFTLNIFIICYVSLCQISCALPGSSSRFQPYRYGYVCRLNYRFPFNFFFFLLLGILTLTAFKYSPNDSSPSPSDVLRSSPKSAFIWLSSLSLPYLYG